MGVGARRVVGSGEWEGGCGGEEGGRRREGEGEGGGGGVELGLGLGLGLVCVCVGGREGGEGVGGHVASLCNNRKLVRH